MHKVIFLILLIISLLTNSLLIHAEGEEFFCGFTYFGSHEVDASQNEAYVFQDKDTLSLTGWRNDEVYAKVAIHVNTNTTIKVSSSSFKNQNEQIEDSNIEIGLLKEANASLGIGYDTSIPHVSIPEIITTEKEFEVLSNQTRYIWITIKIPSSQTPGVYEGSINIESSQTKKELKINLTVLSHVLEDSTSRYSLNLWQYPFSSLRYYDCLEGVEPFSEKHLQVLKEELKIYHAIGGRSITVSILDEPWGHQTYDDYPSMVDWVRNSDYSIYFDFSKFDTWVNLCMECGIDERIDTFSILPFDNAVTYVLEDGSRVRYPMVVGSDEWKEVWTYFLTTYIEHLEAKGWFEKTYIFIDERDMGQVEEAVKLIKGIKNQKGQSLKIASAINRVPNNESVFDEIDYVSISIAATPDESESFDEFIKHRKELGLETTLYNCSTNFPNTFAISEPDETIWTLEYMEKKGFDGFLRWALNAWNENPNQTLDYQHFEAGDILLIYPDLKDTSSPIPKRTVRLNMIEYGLHNNMKYHYLCEQLPPKMRQQLIMEFNEMNRTYGAYNMYGSMVASHDANHIITFDVLKHESIINKYARLLEYIERINQE